MKEDNISQLGDYDAPFCEQQYTHGSCYISVFKSFDQFNIPPNCLKFWTFSQFWHYRKSHEFRKMQFENIHISTFKKSVLGYTKICRVTLLLKLTIFRPDEKDHRVNQSTSRKGECLGLVFVRENV